MNPQRKSLRLKGYDYSQHGYYFITICTQQREYLFGEIENRKMMMFPAGVMIEKWWHELQHKFAHFESDIFIVMPNHIHGIIAINPGRGGPMCPSLSEIIQWFKTMTTNEYIQQVKEGNWKPFNKRTWQRNYYEHIIRNEKTLDMIREYIVANPLQWEEDRNNFEKRMELIINVQGIG